MKQEAPTSLGGSSSQDIKNRHQDIKKGDLGGYVESERNLSQYDNCWIYDNAIVFGNAKVIKYTGENPVACLWDEAKIKK